ncbi:MAG: dihydrodipicolinate synthase family protein [Promethearchaeota archaeon]
MPPINGVICNTLTFYDRDLKIDQYLNSLLLRHILTNEANNLLFFGDIGDSELFSEAEKIKLIEIATKLTESKIPLFIGIYGNEIDEVIDQIENIDKKFDNLNFMISPPISEKNPVDMVISYFENILSSINPKSQIYLINNPLKFSKNEIEPEMLKKLIEFSNLKGLNDSFYNIKKCKSFIQFLNNEFSIFCGLEEYAHSFFQLVPLNQRKYTGIISSISNLSNMYSKLYKYALEDNILELLQLQEQINDFRNKLYEVKGNQFKEKIGLKHAFLYLYRDLISSSTDISNNIDEILGSQINSISKERIEATVNYLLNQKLIYKLYFISKKDLYQFSDIIDTFSKIDVLVKQGKVKKIKGPYILDANTVYRVNFENNQLVFRFHTSPYSQFDNLIKEKLLYPFLDNTLNPNDTDLRIKVKEILNIRSGSYVFAKENPPIIPVSNLVFYDETKETVPYIFSVQDYIRGKPLFQLINQYINEGKNLNTKKFLDLFNNLGDHLANLHEVGFDAFYTNINNIGKNLKISYIENFENELEDKIQEAKRNKIDFITDIKAYIRDNRALIEDEREFVLLHNDFKSQNIIVKDQSGVVNINGFVDFDNWCVGSRAKDFVKIDYWILKPLNNPLFYNSFYNAYSKFYKIDSEFKKKIEIYKLLWLLDEYNLETELIRKSNQLDILRKSSMSLEGYIFEIKAIIR